MNGETETQEDR